MAREITQRELRNESGKIMRALDEGESFVVTRNGVPVGELLPLRRRQFVSAEAAVAAFAGAPAIDIERFRADVDRFVARAYGRVYAAVAAAGRKARGRRAFDLLIAATAAAVELPLYTLDTGDFAELDGLV